MPQNYQYLGLQASPRKGTRRLAPKGSGTLPVNRSVPRPLLPQPAKVSSSVNQSTAQHPVSSSLQPQANRLTPIPSTASVSPEVISLSTPQTKRSSSYPSASEVSAMTADWSTVPASEGSMSDQTPADEPETSQADTLTSSLLFSEVSGSEMRSSAKPSEAAEPLLDEPMWSPITPEAAPSQPSYDSAQLFPSAQLVSTTQVQSELIASTYRQAIKLRDIDYRLTILESQMHKE